MAATMPTEEPVVAAKNALVKMVAMPRPPGMRPSSLLPMS